MLRGILLRASDMVSEQVLIKRHGRRDELRGSGKEGRGRVPLKPIRRRRWLVILAILVSIVLAFVKTLFTYRSSTLI